MKTVISGAGIAGLLLALKLHQIGIECIVYEQAPGFQDGVGGAVGMYPNGLRVIKSISQELLNKVRSAGRDYTLRKWMRHDGSIVAVAEEKHLIVEDDKDLQSMGIKRWRLQKILFQECVDRNIKILLNKRINNVRILDSGMVECHLDKESFVCDYLFGCDGVKSAIRTSLFGSGVEPLYTGITCLMGSAPIAKTSPINGISFPSSPTTKIHACYYPASETEIIFQLFFPTSEKPETWKALSPDEAKKECLELQEMMVRDGWDSMFTDPVGNSDSVLRVGLRARDPIPVWHAPQTNAKIVLLGDAAHPPVPYIGQGAQMAIEDVGILVSLIQKLCKPTVSSPFNKEKFDQVIKFYETLRLPRTTAMLAASKSLGDMQLSRGNSPWYEIWQKEIEIQDQVKKHGTMPIMFSGARYNFQQEVDNLFSSKL
jgi:2-polyprenyl-6-methoxyphenol hydroxylase-like FAD-dependent oxidoreductase